MSEEARPQCAVSTCYRRALRTVVIVHSGCFHVRFHGVALCWAHVEVSAENPSECEECGLWSTLAAYKGPRLIQGGASI